ncbi:hypothetical protein A9Q91_05410 [Candidatus Gracilibacteria bacterium 28_42_T64]|nr:hypothetical protein A9Q91_05410 [Candidatus Gracilibacteria bacterium 28_42_T64]
MGVLESQFKENECLDDIGNSIHSFNQPIEESVRANVDVVDGVLSHEQKGIEDWGAKSVTIRYDMQIDFNYESEITVGSDQELYKFISYLHINEQIKLLNYFHDVIKETEQEKDIVKKGKELARERNEKKLTFSQRRINTLAYYFGKTPEEVRVRQVFLRKIYSGEPVHPQLFFKRNIEKIKVLLLGKEEVISLGKRCNK